MSITRHHCSTVCLLVWNVNHLTSLQYCVFVGMECQSPDITAVLCVCSITRYGMSITRHHCSTVCLLVWNVNHPTSLQYCVFVGMECQSHDITAVLCVCRYGMSITRHHCSTVRLSVWNVNHTTSLQYCVFVGMECQSHDITAVLCVCRYGMSITRHHCSTVCLLVWNVNHTTSLQYCEFLVWNVNHPTSLQYCVFVGMECQSHDITAVLCVCRYGMSIT